MKGGDGTGGEGRRVEGTGLERTRGEGRAGDEEGIEGRGDNEIPLSNGIKAVSYTHLTLPTIYSV